MTRHLFADPKIRKLLALPLGEVVEEKEAVKRAKSCPGPVITVGDVVSKAFLGRGLRPKIVIFDEKTHREDSGQFPQGLLEGYQPRRAENPAGTISLEAYEELKRLISLSGQFALQILGEEDLLGLPAIEVAPVGSLVFYGQPGSGVVVVPVDCESKAMAASILERSRVT